MNENWIRAALISVGVLIASQAALGQARQLAGAVKDVCGRSMPGATVTVVNESETVARTVSGSEGRYSFGVLPPGSLTLTFAMNGFETQRHPIEFPQTGAAVERSVRLLPDLTLKETLTVSHADPNIPYRKYSIHGIVTGRDSGAVSAAIIRFQDVAATATGIRDLCTTDELGRYVLSGWSPKPTRWQIAVEADGYRAYTLSDLELTPDEPRAINIRLESR